MPYIKVNTSQLSGLGSDAGNISSTLAQITRDFASAGRRLDWEVQCASNIRSQLSRIENELSCQQRAMSGMSSFLMQTVRSYNQINGENRDNADEVGEIGKTSLPSGGSAVIIRGEIPSKILQILNPGCIFGTMTVSQILIDAISKKFVNGVLDGFVKTLRVSAPMVKVSSTLFDLGEALGKLNYAQISGLFDRNLVVKRVGDYVRVYGKNLKPVKGSSFFDDLIGGKVARRYKVGSDAYIGSGIGFFDPQASWVTKFKSLASFQFKNFFSDTFSIVKTVDGKTVGNVGAILGWASVGIETVIDLVGNVQNGASTSKIAADVVTDVGVGAGGMAVSALGAKGGATIGAAIGTAIGGPPGTIIGGIVGGFAGGIASGFAYDTLTDGVQVGGKSVSAWISYGLENAFDAVGDAAAKGAEAAQNALKDMGDAVGDAIQSGADAIFSAGEKLSRNWNSLWSWAT